MQRFIFVVLGHLGRTQMGLGVPLYLLVIIGGICLCQNYFFLGKESLGTAEAHVSPGTLQCAAASSALFINTYYYRQPASVFSSAYCPWS